MIVEVYVVDWEGGQDVKMGVWIDNLVTFDEYLIWGGKVIGWVFVLECLRWQLDIQVEIFNRYLGVMFRKEIKDDEKGVQIVFFRQMLVCKYEYLKGIVEVVKIGVVVVSGLSIFGERKEEMEL